MQEVIKSYAICVRMSSESVVLCGLPFELNTEKGVTLEEELMVGEYCLEKMGGSWIPMGYFNSHSLEVQELMMNLVREGLFS